MKRANRASFEFSLVWESEVASHNERFYMAKVDFWRDVFPGTMRDKMATLQYGETCFELFGAARLVEPYDLRKVYRFPRHGFASDWKGPPIIPKVGRFYPLGLAWQSLKSFSGHKGLFRLIEIKEDILTVDTNHPLARYPLTLTARHTGVIRAGEEHGGSCSDLAEMLTENGPGLQVPYPGCKNDFYSLYPFVRNNNSDDALFYQKPRMVHHLDQAAIAVVRELYGRLLSPQMQVLDLMSSWTSPLPENFGGRVTGLGMNHEELANNMALGNFLVHDLNQAPVLYFDTGSFDAVICTASIEYLMRPREVVEEVARVLRPGGFFITVFSDRWFPGKEMVDWADMHPFERLGYVLDLYLQSKSFTALNTETIRGLPRPVDDPHYGERWTADPIFAVWGRVKG